MSRSNAPTVTLPDNHHAGPLHHAGSYERRVHASLERIWENVFDWEHLAHLHDGSFADCSLVEQGRWGWCVDLTPRGAEPQRVQLRADRATGRYTSTTIDGAGVGTEIRVMLDEIEPHIVDVTVEFHLPGSRTDRSEYLGRAYAAVYATLWDEDEVMMQARERALAAPTQADRSVEPIDLGDARDVRANLPLAFQLGGMAFQLVEHDGDLIAHSAVCPHWLGPLQGPLQNGKIRCPWHGYVFDIVTRRCELHSTLRLAMPPLIRIIEGRVVAAFSHTEAD